MKYLIAIKSEKWHSMKLKRLLFHHERYNNNGYYGLPYDNLPIYPKIIGLCDIYDALTSKRPFRSAIEPSNALKAILNAINQQFDYQLINIFINKLGPILNNTQSFYTHNDICELNTQELAIIKDFGINDMLKPKVIIFCKFQRDGEQLLARFYEKPLEIDLSQDPNNGYMIKIINNYKQLQSIQKKLEEKNYYNRFTMPIKHYNFDNLLKGGPSIQSSITYLYRSC
ncbi:MAG: HD-GYP domain-containing protein [Spirochaetota bacterium]